MSTAPATNTRVDALRARASTWDVLALLVFVLVGRSSHGEAITLDGVIRTGYPFLVGAVIGHLLAWRVGSAGLRGGMIVWVATLLGGMTIRALTGQGVAPAFVVVASLTLAVLLLGWRAALAWYAARRPQR